MSCDNPMITTSHKLTAEDIMISGPPAFRRGAWGYCLKLNRDVEKLFPELVLENENVIYVTLYAYVQLGFDSVENELDAEVIFCQGELTQERRYALSEAEQRMIHKKILEYELKRLHGLASNLGCELEAMDLGFPPAVSIVLPDMRRIVAERKNDPEYPGIELSLVSSSGNAHLVAWAEYNTVRDDYSDEDRLRMMVWAAEEDNPAINFSIDTGKFEPVED